MTTRRFGVKIDLYGKIILITGASRGIGLEICKQCLKAGAVVAAQYKENDILLNDLKKNYNEQLFIYRSDLAISDQCNQLFNNVLKELNRVDVLINNAGIFLKAGLDEPNQQWLEKWHTTLDVNLTAVGLLCKLAITHFCTQKKGIIINISSRAAFRGDDPDYFAYAASKGGLVALTRSIARGFGKQGITAFLVAPGFVRTDMAQSYFDVHGEESVIDSIALNKLTEPADVAPMVVFLASGLAAHATGCTIDINAGSYVH
jgi:NAD(P)-dependent dehydrogenase (short-subunit alcohol dehydrogenase family)